MLVTPIEIINVLHAHRANLPAHLNAIAADLIRKHTSYGWTDKQAKFARSLADQAMGRSVAPAATQVGAVAAGLHQIFAKAAGKRLQAPKLRIIIAEQTDREQVVALSVASAASKVPGSINVTTTGAFESRTWFGRVVDGSFQPSRDGRELAGVIAIALQAFAGDPLGEAARFGKLTGQCCFCGRSLKQEDSTGRGYGPVCAKRFGLEG